MLGTSRAVAAATACLLVAAPARAQPAKPSATQKRQAQDLVKQAIGKSQAKEHQAAIALYEEAYALVPLPALLSNIGTEYQALGDPAKALEHFCRYLVLEPSGPLSKYAREQARALQDAQGHRDLAVCAAPPPLPKEAPRVEPVASAVEPARRPPPPPPTAPPPRPARPGRGLRVGGLVTGGVGVVSAGLGAYFGLRARAISDDISSQPIDQPWRDDIADYEAQGQRAETLQLTLLAAGGALLVGGTVLYVIGRAKGRAAAERLTLVPTASADGGGLVVGGRF